MDGDIIKKRDQKEELVRLLSQHPPTRKRKSENNGARKGTGLPSCMVVPELRGRSPGRPLYDKRTGRWSKRHAGEVDHEKRKKNFKTHVGLIFCISLFIIGAISAVFISQQSKSYNPQFQPLYTQLTSVYGQESAVKKILLSLHHHFNDHNARCLIHIFYGGTGVGKSMAASIINTVMMQLGYRVHSSFASMPRYEYFLQGLDVLIIDDMEAAEGQFLSKLQMYLAGCKNLTSGHSLYVILVFNGIDVNKFKYEFLEPLHHASIHYEEIYFQLLSIPIVRKCILNDLESRGIHTEPEVVDRIIASDKYVDERGFVKKGCKLANSIWIQF
ncbi:unnamed protein product [Darwinula stevensoni]|uniref:Uncharacterized protein n=1 Tax=Darwinula stevensoni TaxID=69355 RepID=A0A7R9A1W6_9CRUS|nr:unnamed protein product [Darwinula stevensoni]CAG0878500.1 unnamed protein product [Darwinula stevensoni]